VCSSDLEWEIIHHDIEKYERFSLLIKLASILISVICLGFHLNVWFALSFLLILWLQDGIWTTFQNRLQARILVLEKSLQNKSEDNNSDAFQLYSQWSEKRQGGVEVVKEYMVSSVKPMAYPYIVLIGLMLLAYQFIQ